MTILDVPVRTDQAPARGLALDLTRFGDRVAVLDRDRTLTYTELADHVDAFARRLGPDRRLVLLAARNDVASLVAYLGAMAAGHPLIIVPGDRATSWQAVAAAYAPDVVVSTLDGEAVVDERTTGERRGLHPELSVLLSTSGSTGSPKLVRLSHTNLRANAEAIAESLGIRPDDRAVTSLPMSYCYGLSVINSHLVRGAALVMTELSVVDPCFWELFARAGGTTFAAVPYTFELLDPVGFPEMDLPSLRYVTQAGGRLAPDTVRRYAEVGRRRGWDLVVMYGQTEATARIAYLPPNLAHAHPETIGVPVPGGDLTIEPVPGGSDGELVYRGPNVMLGYAESPADLALGRTVHELRTGDLGRRRADGLYEVVGRRSRFVKVVGLRVDLGRVEEILRDVGVTSAAAGVDGRIVVATQGDHDAALLGKLLAEGLGVPRGTVAVHPVAAIPRTGNGKPDHAAVLALDVPAPTVRRPAEPDGPADVRRIFAEELDLPDVGVDSTFVGLGGDSLSYVATSVRLEAALGHLPADWHLRPVRDLVPVAGRPRRRRLLAPVETSVVIRAVAIVLIVGTHVHLFSWRGTAHLLLAVAGYSFARFQLSGDRVPRLRRQLHSVARIVAPSAAFIAFAYAVTDRYGMANVFLLNALLGPAPWSTEWHFWFVEVLVYVLVAVTALLAIPGVDRVERRFPFAFALALLGLGLLTRVGLVDLGGLHTAPVLWLFAFGWAVQRSTGTRQRALLSVVALLAVPGAFGYPGRETITLVGLLLLVWLPTIRVPVVLHRPMVVLANASLYVYLTHWLVYPELITVHPALALGASLVAGVAYRAVFTRCWRWVSHRCPSTMPPAALGLAGSPARRRAGQRA